MKRRKAPKHPRPRPNKQQRHNARVAQPWARLAPLILAASGILVYINSFTGVFLFDDLKRIVANRRIQSLGVFWDTLGSSRRPVADLSFALNYQLDRLGVWGYHLVNLAAHVAAALTLYGVVRRSLLRPAFADGHRRSAPWLALTVALIWVVHPLQTQSVDYLVQRSEALMGLFYLLTLYCVIRAADAAKPGRWHAAAVAACALGMGSKAVMVTAPVVMLLYDRLFLSDSIGHILRRRWGLYAGLAATWLVLVLAGVAGGVLDPSATTSTVGFGYQGVTPVEYARTQPEIILHYLRLSFWPAGLCLDYGWPAAESWAAVAAAAGAIVAALLAGTVWALLRKPWLGFAGAWFFLILAPTSTFIPIRDLAFEHRMYLPLAAVVLVAVVAGRRLATLICDRYAATTRVRREVITTIVVVIAVGLGVRTLVRNLDYQSPVAMWTSVVKVRPNHSRAHQNLGFELTNRGKSDEALEHFRRAVELDAQHAESQHSLGRELVMRGQPDEAIPFLREAVRLEPQHYRAHTNLGIALAELGQLGEAIEHYEKSLEIKPNDANTWYALGAAYVGQKRYPKAARAFEEVLRLDPSHRDARQTLGSIRRALPQGTNLPAQP